MVGAEQHLGGGGEVRRAADRPRAETNVTFLRRWSDVRFWGVKQTLTGRTPMSAYDPKRRCQGILADLDT